MTMICTSFWLILSLLLGWISFSSTKSSAEFQKFPGTFDPSGQLIHLEYAKKAVRKYGGLVIAMKGKDGVILASSKKKKSQSKLILQSFSQKTTLLHDELMMAVSGLALDSHVITETARKICQKYYERYQLSIPIEKLSHELASTVHRMTMSIGMRPLGVKVLLAGYDSSETGERANRYKIYTIEPEGACYTWKAVAIGEGEERMNEELMKIMKESEEHERGTAVDHQTSGLAEVTNLVPRLFRAIKKDEDNDAGSSFEDYHVSYPWLDRFPLFNSLLHNIVAHSYK